MIKSYSLAFLIFLVSTLSVAGQQSFSTLKSNVNRLNVDFEVKDYKNPDPVLLNSIDLDNYEQFRQVSSRVCVTDVSTGYILVLYSQKETDLNRAKKEPLHKFQANITKQEKANK